MDKVCKTGTSCQEEEGVNKSLTGTIAHGSSVRTGRVWEVIFSGRERQIRERASVRNDLGGRIEVYRKCMGSLLMSNRKSIFTE
jgi:hypothetical protein